MKAAPIRRLGLAASWLTLVGLLALPAAAQPTVTFYTYPSDAEVRLVVSGNQGGYLLGRAGQPVQLPAALIAGRNTISLLITHAGYQPRTENLVPLQALLAQGRYPAQGRLLLEPQSWVWSALTFVKERPLTVGLVLGLALIAVAAYLRLLSRSRRDRERADRLTRLGDTITRPDSLSLEQLGQFRVLDRLGEGGMAVVYRAVPNATLRESQAVAVKVMNRTLSQEGEFRERFRREILTVQGLQHPGIVTVYDYGEQDGRLFLVMELVPGQTLGDWIGPNGRSLPEAMPVIRPLFLALAHAHERGVVHRDLKPDNIKITPEGRVKVLDFGLARRHDLHTMTKTGTALGTPGYMPPEHLAENRFDERSDQYALGMIVYEMLTGRLPYEGDDLMQLIHQTLSVPAPPLTRFRADLPAAAEAVVLRMLAKDPERRYPNLQAALAALEEVSA